ncbi:MAG: hypothetical protein V1775_02445 [Bacteroidota bacterium]
MRIHNFQVQPAIIHYIDSFNQVDELIARFGLERLEIVDDVTLEMVSMLPKYCTSSKLKFRLTEKDNFNTMFRHGCDYLGKRFDTEFEEMFMN